MADRIHCVMIVDDDDDVRENLEEILSREGFQTHSCANAIEALAQLREAHDPCVVLLDLVMPSMDGWEFLDEMLKMPLGTASHPVVVVSAAADAESARRMPGVVAVLRKPFELQELINTVNDFASPIAREESSA